MNNPDLMVSVYGLLPDLDIPKEDTVLFLLPGLQRWRLTKCNWWRYATTLLVAGTRADPLYTTAEVYQLTQQEKFPPKEFRHQGYTEHTPGQMRWIVDQLESLGGMRQLICCTASYHLSRSACTFAAQYMSKQCRVKFHFACLPLIAGRSSTEFLKGFASDENLSEERAGPSSMTYGGEESRMDLYQDRGDVATDREFAQFLDLITP